MYSSHLITSYSVKVRYFVPALYTFFLFSYNNNNNILIHVFIIIRRKKKICSARRRLSYAAGLIYCIHIFYLYTFFIVLSIYCIIIEQIFNRDVCHELLFVLLFVIFIYRTYRYNSE